MKRERKFGRRQDGFSLIELLIVLVIIGLLAGLVGPRLFKHTKTANQKAAQGQIALFETALDSYRLDMGKYPTTEQGLQALRTNPGDNNRWDGPYLRKAIPVDPWQNSYEYESPSQHGDFAIWSLGADGAPGGEDENADITNWTADDA